MLERRMQLRQGVRALQHGGPVQRGRVRLGECSGHGAHLANRLPESLKNGVKKRIPVFGRDVEPADRVTCRNGQMLATPREETL